MTYFAVADHRGIPFSNYHQQERSSQSSQRLSERRWNHTKGNSNGVVVISGRKSNETTNSVLLRPWTSPSNSTDLKSVIDIASIPSRAPTLFLCNFTTDDMAAYQTDSSDDIITNPPIAKILHGMTSLFWSKLTENYLLQIRSEYQMACPQSNSDHPAALGPSPFDESLYFSLSDYQGRFTKKRLWKFLNKVFKRTELFPIEYGIIAVIYIDRLLRKSNTILNVKTFKLVFFLAMVTASKVWEEYTLWNEDFLDAFPESWMSLSLLNHLELKFLQLISFDLSISSSSYVKYYFEIRAMGRDATCESFSGSLTDLKSRRATLHKQHFSRSLSCNSVSP